MGYVVYLLFLSLGYFSGFGLGFFVWFLKGEWGNKKHICLVFLVGFIYYLFKINFVCVHAHAHYFYESFCGLVF